MLSLEKATKPDQVRTNVVTWAHADPPALLDHLRSEGVLGGRITPQKFVELTATNPAKAYGLHPRKGTIAIGSDADLVIWDERDFVLTNAQLHHEVDYTPYEGMRLSAWPAMTREAAMVTATTAAAIHRPYL